MKHVLLSDYPGYCDLADDCSSIEPSTGFDLYEVPAGANLHKVTAVPAEYKAGKG